MIIVYIIPDKTSHKPAANPVRSRGKDRYTYAHKQSHTHGPAGTGEEEDSDYCYFILMVDKETVAGGKVTNTVDAETTQEKHFKGRGPQSDYATQDDTLQSDQPKYAERGGAHPMRRRGRPPFRGSAQYDPVLSELARRGRGNEEIEGEIEETVGPKPGVRYVKKRKTIFQ